MCHPAALGALCAQCASPTNTHICPPLFTLHLLLNHPFQIPNTSRHKLTTPQISLWLFPAHALGYFGRSLLSAFETKEKER